VFGGRCQWVLDAARQAVEWLSQPLGFESLALRGHSTFTLVLDTVSGAFIIESGGRRSIPILRKPRMTTGAFVCLGGSVWSRPSPFADVHLILLPTNWGQSRLSPYFRITVCKIDLFPSADCSIVDHHEGQQADSPTSTGCPLPDLWRGAGREVRTHHGTAPDRAAS
jgi:hypothetical protein